MPCPHEETEPVALAVTGETIGQICTACLESLPHWWGCPDCDFSMSFTMSGESWPILEQPCATHFVPF